jgi:uncharacterized protein (DUF433 family)
VIDAAKTLHHPSTIELRANDRLTGRHAESRSERHRPAQKPAQRRFLESRLDGDRIDRRADPDGDLSGISVDPDLRFGKPCIKGTRLDVATVVGLFAAAETIETVSSEYQLSVEQIRAALAYAVHVAAHLPPAVRWS